MCLIVTGSASSHVSSSSSPSSHQWPSVNIHWDLEPEADHDQEWDQGILSPSPSLLMIYALHLPQAMRGTTLNEQHKPHSLMSNFSIAYFWDIWWFMICLSLVAWLPRCCLGLCHPSADDTRDDISWHDHKQFTRTIRAWDPGPVMKSVKTNF